MAAMLSALRVGGQRLLASTEAMGNRVSKTNILLIHSSIVAPQSQSLAIAREWVGSFGRGENGRKGQVTLSRWCG
jgi:hypothetical protein